MINRFFINFDTDRVPANTDNKNLFKIDLFKCIEIYCTVSFDGMFFIFYSSFLFCFVSILFQQIVRIYVNFYESSTMPMKIMQYVSRDYFHWAISRINFTLTIRRSLRNFTNNNKTEQNSPDRCLN